MIIPMHFRVQQGALFRSTFVWKSPLILRKIGISLLIVIKNTPTLKQSFNCRYFSDLHEKLSSPITPKSRSLLNCEIYQHGRVSAQPHFFTLCLLVRVRIAQESIRQGQDQVRIAQEGDMQAFDLVRISKTQNFIEFFRLINFQSVKKWGWAPTKHVHQ